MHVMCQRFRLLAHALAHSPAGTRTCTPAFVCVCVCVCVCAHARTNSHVHTNSGVERHVPSAKPWCSALRPRIRSLLRAATPVAMLAVLVVYIHMYV
jgi:hypothetical protein